MKGILNKVNNIIKNLGFSLLLIPIPVRKWNFQEEADFAIIWIASTLEHFLRLMRTIDWNHILNGNVQFAKN